MVSNLGAGGCRLAEAVDVVPRLLADGSVQDAFFGVYCI